MTRSWLFPHRPQRATEASPEQLVRSGALGGGWDPMDGDGGPAWRPVGSAGRPVPEWTQERARAHSVAAYRINPMARAIVDTYTSFAVGDSGVRPQVSNPKVAAIVDQWWKDPRNALGSRQPVLLRSAMLNGEALYELMIGPLTGVTRYRPIDPSIVRRVLDHDYNPLTPDRVVFQERGADRDLIVAQVDDRSGLRDGQCMWWVPWKALDTDQRSMPFLTPVLDWLDAYDTVLSNLVDRTALARYMVWDVTIDGDQTAVDDFVKARGGTHVPPSGGVEVHNKSVAWEAKSAQTGAYEDSKAGGSILTNMAAGAGLSKTWLAEPEGANRATSQTMAEPVRRRIGGLQKEWLDFQREFACFAVDRAVAAGRIPSLVQATDSTTGSKQRVPAADTVSMNGPEVAAADAKLNADVLLNLATGLEKMIATGALSTDAAQLLARKAWEGFMGVPWRAELATPDADPDKIADHIDSSGGGKPGSPASRLTAV